MSHSEVFARVKKQLESAENGVLNQTPILRDDLRWLVDALEDSARLLAKSKKAHDNLRIACYELPEHRKKAFAGEALFNTLQHDVSELSRVGRIGRLKKYLSTYRQERLFGEETSVQD